MDIGGVRFLGRLIWMGSSSLLQYVSEAFPWSADPLHAAYDRLRKIAAEEREDVVALTRWIQKQRVRVPPLGAYPSHFTTINFCSLDYLLPKLVAEHEKEIAEITTRLAACDDEDIRKLAQHYLDMKRDHLQALKELAATKTAA